MMPELKKEVDARDMTEEEILKVMDDNSRACDSLREQVEEAIGDTEAEDVLKEMAGSLDDVLSGLTKEGMAPFWPFLRINDCLMALVIEHDMNSAVVILVMAMVRLYMQNIFFGAVLAIKQMNEEHDGETVH